MLYRYIDVWVGFSVMAAGLGVLLLFLLGLSLIDKIDVGCAMRKSGDIYRDHYAANRLKVANCMKLRDNAKIDACIETLNKAEGGL